MAQLPEFNKHRQQKGAENGFTLDTTGLDDLGIRENIAHDGFTADHVGSLNLLSSANCTFRKLSHRRFVWATSTGFEIYEFAGKGLALVAQNSTPQNREVILGVSKDVYLSVNRGSRLYVNQVRDSEICEQKTALVPNSASTIGIFNNSQVVVVSGSKVLSLDLSSRDYRGSTLGSVPYQTRGLEKVDHDSFLTYSSNGMITIFGGIKNPAGMQTLDSGVSGLDQVNVLNKECFILSAFDDAIYKMFKSGGAWKIHSMRNIASSPLVSDSDGKGLAAFAGYKGSVSIIDTFANGNEIVHNLNTGSTANLIRIINGNTILALSKNGSLHIISRNDRGWRSKKSRQVTDPVISIERIDEGSFWVLRPGGKLLYCHV